MRRRPHPCLFLSFDLPHGSRRLRKIQKLIDGFDGIQKAQDLLIAVSEQIGSQIIIGCISSGVLCGAKHFSAVERPHIILGGVAGSVEHSPVFHFCFRYFGSAGIQDNLPKGNRAAGRSRIIMGFVVKCIVRIDQTDNIVYKIRFTLHVIPVGSGHGQGNRISSRLRISVGRVMLCADRGSVSEIPLPACNFPGALIDKIHDCSI